ncbi:sialate O-acetylesterase [Paenibacillus sp. MBLB4367]|uniref:sialate O-acetylesterase n=1 Tax=Paenibacillus sp. MBLB4367 TaxID=3384767 RepID=UPI0039080500
MSIARFGVHITEGPQHWAIIQQREGFGTIAVKGFWSKKSGAGAIESVNARVYARVVREDEGGMIVPWQPCSMSGEEKWSAVLSGIPAGGLYRVETCLMLFAEQQMELATRGDMIHHIGVGDIWVIAGQSNAAGYGRGPVSDPPEPGIHLLRHSGRWDMATHPFNESTESVQPLNGEPVNPGHSPYLAFARLVKKETGIPIGLLQTALGGSPLERWNPDEIGDLYRNMMTVIESAGGRVKGVLWYQGCSDCDAGHAGTYLERFTRVVQHWRDDLGDAELPVLTVQLNRYAAYADGEEGNRCWGIVREAQRTAAAQIPNVFVVPALDCPLSDTIHNSPAGNLVIGERSARAALAGIYGKPMAYRAPSVKEAKFGPDPADGKKTVRLTFTDVAGELFAIGPRELVFSIEDRNGIMPISSWRIAGKDRIELELPRTAEGRTVVHGAYEANPAALLPIDTVTQMPMLAFYGLRVEQSQPGEYSAE